MMDGLERLAELGAQLNQVRAELRAEALAQVAAGKPKRQVAQAADISRVTLDAWIRAAE